MVILLAKTHIVLARKQKLNETSLTYPTREKEDDELLVSDNEQELLEEELDGEHVDPLRKREEEIQKRKEELRQSQMKATVHMSEETRTQLKEISLNRKAKKSLAWSNQNIIAELVMKAHKRECK